MTPVVEPMPGTASPKTLLRTAVRQLPDPFGQEVLFRWFAQWAPWVDRLAVEGFLEAGTVNEPSRRHYPQPADLVFQLPDGRYEPYDLVRHGRWSKLGERVRAGHVLPFRPAA